VHSLTRTIETDVCVVGAGLVGVAHALEARRRGLSVVVLERDRRAGGASVRDSGHLFFSALASGGPLAAAPRARSRWLELASRAGVPVAATGTLIVARHRDELSVLEGVAGDAGRRAHIVRPTEIAELVPIPLDGVLGGLHAPGDLRIDPRSTPAALARLLARDPSARVEWGMQVHHVEPGVVHAGPLRVRAPVIVACVGTDEHLLAPEPPPGPGAITAARTQMLRLAAPTGRRYGPTLADGLSLLAHAAFVECGVESLRARVELETPELMERGVSLVVSQDRSGDLVVGSTTTYTESPAPFSHARLDELVLGRVRDLLGVAPPVRQRWSSTHLSAADGGGDFLVSRPMPGVRAVRSITSTAAALCHVQAETLLDELLSEGALSSEYIHVRDARRRRAGSPVHDHARAFACRAPLQT
jgi:FAD dependent oxidoreductase TIGR03364